MDLKESKTNEELFIEAKALFELYKKQIGNCVKKGSQEIIVNFEDLLMTSHDLTEMLISKPEDTLLLLEAALEDTGLIKHPKIFFNNIPNAQKVRLSLLRKRHDNQLIMFEAKIINITDIQTQIENNIYECPSCGTVISIPFDNKKRFPETCNCGRKGNFKLIRESTKEFVIVTLQEEESKYTIDIEFNSSFFDNENYKEILKGSNIVTIIGILKYVPEEIGSNNLKMKIIPLGLKLERQSNLDLKDIEEYLNSLKSLGSKGAFEFEKFVGILFEKKGYQVEVTKKTKDFGVDVLAQNDSEKIGIQCKLFRKDIKITNKTVQEAIGSVRSPYKADKLIFITTAYDFTNEAIKQKDKYDIPVELWNRKKLVGEIAINMYDLEEGWQLLNDSEKMEMASKQETDFKINSFTTQSSLNQRHNIIMMRDMILKLRNLHGKMIPLNILRQEVGSQLTDNEFEDTIEKLKEKAEIFQPRSGFVQRLEDE